MLGEREAIVVDVRPFDVTVAYRDRRVETARLGRESMPADLQPGEEVLVSSAVNMIVAIRRSAG